MWAIALVVIVVSLWLLWRKRTFSYFKNLGIPGPEPNIIFGNLLEIYSKNPIQCHKEWIDKYGKVVGNFVGTKPSVLIADVDLLKKIQVSDFHKFMNRPSIFRGDDNPKQKEKRREGFSRQLVVIKDKEWKDTRSIITPTFTTAKMKMMMPIVNSCIDSLMKNVEKKSSTGEMFDIYSLYQSLTMDTIGRTAFGIQTDVQNDPNDPLLRSARLLFSSTAQNPLTILAVSFRKFETLWTWLGRFRLMLKNKGVNPVKELINSVKNVIQARRKDKENRRPDLLQLMIDAKIDKSTVSTADLTATDEHDATEKKDTGSTSGKLIRQMTDDDILDNSVLFFLAGYETTSTALAFITLMLLNHEDVQEKVREEVMELLEKEGELDYYSVNKLQYLDQVINESLRMYPPIYLFVNRECGEDIQLGQYKFKKGLAIQVPVFYLHRDPELWPEPDKFQPERFAPENKSKINPLAFQPFGAGPRNCVGMRLALMETKLALSKLLATYKLKPCNKTSKEPLDLKIAPASLNPKNGVYLRVIPVGK